MAGDDEPKKTLFPVTFEVVQRILNQLGYGLAFYNPTTDRLHFQLEKDMGVSPAALKALKGQAPPNPPQEVNILKPDFACDAHKDELVYDREYIVDLLDKINGQVRGDAGTNLLAFLSEIKKPH